MKNWIITKIEKLIDWLSILRKKLLPKRNYDLPFNTLSPTDEAEKIEDYLNTLEWALNNRDKIKNIAIAGPYGSGKSSVIKTFQKKHKYNSDYSFLNISLATFKEEIIEEKPKEKPKEKENILRLIELSILQQLFYHEKDNKIPDSRFKKIKSHKNLYLWFITI
jgi:DNA replication protein DnaC